jgi:hypothetical protein
MVSASQIRERLADFLANRIDLDSFEDWIVRFTWNIHQSGSTAAEAVTFSVEELLSEYSDKQITESVLRYRLRNILDNENKLIDVVERNLPQYLFKSSSPVASLPVAV